MTQTFFDGYPVGTKLEVAYGSLTDTYLVTDQGLRLIYNIGKDTYTAPSSRKWLLREFPDWCYNAIVIRSTLPSAESDQQSRPSMTFHPETLKSKATLRHSSERSAAQVALIREIRQICGQG